MKILDLSPRFAFPPDDGGKIVLANTLKYFKMLGADVHYFCFSDDDIPQKLLDEAGKYGKVVVYKKSMENGAALAIKSLLTMRSTYLIKHYSDEILAFVEELHQKEHFDVIHCEHTAMAQIGIAMKHKYNIPIGLRLHNIEYKIWELYARQLKWCNPMKYFIALQAQLLKKGEVELISKVDVCWTITDVEKDHAKELAPEANIFTSSVGVDFEQFPLSDNNHREAHSLIIATTYKWVHNVDGLLWFLDNVLPIVHQTFADVKLRILGKEAGNKFEGYKHIGVDVVGYVDEIKPYFDKSAIYIAPLFVGAGVRIKILEAMAMGLPVVASKVSAAGIEASQSDGLFVSDSPEENATMIISLMQDAELRNNLGKAARKFIEDNFDWEENVKIMYDKYFDLVHSKSI